jgi:hypothetical protein
MVRILGRMFGGGTAGGPDRYRLLVAQSQEELRLKTVGHDRLWGLGEADWSLDQHTGLIVFSTPDGPTATAAAQIIGTYNPTEGTWRWAWDHPDVLPTLRQHAQHVRAYGERHGLPRLTTRTLACTEQEAWAFTAVACKLCNAQGAYRGVTGNVWVFLTFGEVQVSAPPPEAPTLVETIAQLEHDVANGRYHRYLARPIPDALDQTPRHLCHTYLQSAETERALLQCADPHLASVLQAYAERLASLAVRQRQPTLVEASVVALGLSMVMGDDAREWLLVLPLPWHAAELLDQPPKNLFTLVAANLPEPARTALHQFVQRAPEDRTLAAMGYQEGRDEEGFRYQRSW